MQDGSKIDKLLVAHEGNWTKEESMFCYDEYKHYEDVQNDLGKGLILKRKGYLKINYRSLFYMNLTTHAMTIYLLSLQQAKK